MAVPLRLRVYRFRDEFEPTAPPDAALTSHLSRQLALGVLPGDGIAVLDWGATSDAEPREAVDLMLAVEPDQVYAVTTALGRWLVEQVAAAGVVTAVSALVHRLRRMRVDSRISDLAITTGRDAPAWTVTLPDPRRLAAGTDVVVRTPEGAEQRLPIVEWALPR